MCGIFGCIGRADALDITLEGLQLQQYRGTDSAGVVLFQAGSDLISEGLRRIGTVDHLKGKIDLLSPRPRGSAAIGHTRYATLGGNSICNIQPIVKKIGKTVAVAHNGDLERVEINGCSYDIDQGRELLQEAAPFDSTSDTEIIIHLLAQNRNGSIISRIVKVLEKIQGAFSLLFLTDDGHLVAARDPWGFRPLWWGQDQDGKYFFSSEDFALNQLGITPVRELNPGEIIVVAPDLTVSHHQLTSQQPSACSFEFVYFAFPASTLSGLSVASMRRKFGHELARELVDSEKMPELDFLSPVPDSGNQCTIGMHEYLNEMGIRVPRRDAFYRSHYSRRSFIAGQADRKNVVDLKHIIDVPLVRGQKVGLVDDSIVRSTTIKRIIEKLRMAGALQVHVFIPAPRIINTCPYGISIKTKQELIANRMTLDETRQEINADSLFHLSLDGYRRCFGSPQNFCMGCFTGIYPTQPITPVG